VTPPANAYDTSEYRLNPGLQQIGAGAAYAKNIDGTGQVVAIVDTGINTGLAEFSGAIDGRSTDIVKERAGLSLTDADGHGTVVAAVIGARKNGVQTQGVAYGAKILAIRADAYSATGKAANEFFTSDIEAATRHATASGVGVINYSLGGEGFVPIGLADAFKQAANRDIILVASAGNDGKDTVTNLIALGVTGDATTGHGIVVGSVGAANTISSFSNRAGGLANSYVVAPGEMIRAVDNDGDAVTATGTSVAAPHVSGAAALLRQAFPHLTGTQIVDLILRTATDLGAPGTDAVYGRGLLNVAGAMAPVGTSSIPTGTTTDTGAEATSTALRLGAAFGDALSGNATLGRTIMLDEYQRAYSADVTGRIARAQPGHELEGWVGGDKGMDFVGTPVGAGGFASFADRTYERGVQVPERAGSGRSFAFTSNITPGTEIGIASGRPMAARFGLAAVEGSTVDPISGDAARSAFLGIADAGRNVSLRTDLGDGLSMAAGVALRRESDGWRCGADRAWGDHGDRQVVMAEMRKTWSAGHVGVQFGELTERGSALDSSGDSAFAFGQPVKTRFTALFAATNLGPVEAFGTWQYGVTADAQLGSGLIRSLSGVRSDSWQLGIARNNVLAERDRLSLSVAQPLRVSSGSAGIDAPVGRTDDGQVLRETSSASLTPSGRQIDIELAYRIMLDEDSELNFGGLMQTSPGHDAGAGPAFATAVRYLVRF
jgi:hypothetical protein